jgi:hypothetical protein
VRAATGRPVNRLPIRPQAAVVTATTDQYGQYGY